MNKIKGLFCILLIAFLLTSCGLFKTTLITNVNGQGTIMIRPDKGSYNVWDDVVLIAVPDEDWKFKYWQGNINTTQNPVKVDMTTSKSITAVFTMEYEVGDVGPTGGYIFFVDILGEFEDWDYLEAAPHGWYDGETVPYGVYEGSDDPWFEWGLPGHIDAPTGLTTGIGSGEKNTEIIVSFHDNLKNIYPEKGDYYTNPAAYYIYTTGTVAAKVCQEAVINGFDDWFLPSIDELELMLLNLHFNGVGEFYPYIYWSSSIGGAHNCAWNQYFFNGFGQDLTDDNGGNTDRVRPCRSF